MFIRTHMGFESKHFVSAAVVTDVGNNINVFSSNGFVYNCFSLTIGKTYALNLHQVIILYLIQIKILILLLFRPILLSSFHHMSVYLLSQLAAIVHCKDCQLTKRDSGRVFHMHKIEPPLIFTIVCSNGAFYNK